jgi:hypothetical protein
MTIQGWGVVLPSVAAALVALVARPFRVGAATDGVR